MDTNNSDNVREKWSYYVTTIWQFLYIYLSLLCCHLCQAVGCIRPWKHHSCNYSVHNHHYANKSTTYQSVFVSCSLSILSHNFTVLFSRLWVGYWPGLCKSEKQACRFPSNASYNTHIQLHSSVIIWAPVLAMERYLLPFPSTHNGEIPRTFPKYSQWRDTS